MSGATRNFESLKRAEEQLEREDMARQEELENNPMMLLEERTAARWVGEGLGQVGGGKECFG